MREPGSAVKIAILIPTHEKVDALFAYDLAQMCILTTSVMPAPEEGEEACSLGVLMNIGTYIHKSRTQLLQQALADGATHVLWLDSDMRFPSHALLKLLQNDVPVCGINYSKRRVPAEFVAIKHVPSEEHEGEFLHTNRDSTGLEEVDILGFGCVLMETAFLRSLPDPATQPWFWFEKTEDGRDIGEDAYFCLKMVKEHCGQRIFVDHDLSQECAHIGQFEYRTSHAEDVAAALAEVEAEEE